MRKKANYLDNIPVRNGDIVWEEIEGQVFLTVEHKGFYSLIAQKVFKTPKQSKIALEGLGSFVWKEIDGKKSIYEIGKLVQAQFGSEAEPVYERLSKYFYALREEGYISFKKVGKQ